MTRSVLVLGGTADAREVAARLEARWPGLALSSLAGRTREPRLPAGRVRIGGFGGVAGLATFLREAEIAAVVDATHPFAAAISANAAAACGAARVPRVALARRPWLPAAGDVWHRVAGSTAAAARAAELGARIFLTIGGSALAPFAAQPDRWYLIRAVEAPTEPLPPRCELLLERGPFTEANEIALLRRYRVEVLVTKDSGGDATAPKLRAARACGIPVVLLDRPAPPAGDLVDDPAAAIRWLAATLQRAGSAYTSSASPCGRPSSALPPAATATNSRLPTA